MLCPHKSVYIEDGEPTIGDYYVCNQCGQVFNSEGIWKQEGYRNEQINKKKPNPEGSGS